MKEHRFISVLAVFILLGGMFILVSDSYTGYSILDSLQSEYVNKSYSADSVTLFKPSTTDLGGVALSGSAYGSGHVRVFLLDSGQAYLLHEVILDDEAVDFSQACIETCGLSLSSSRYLIRYEVPVGVTYHVDEILYSEGSVENLDTDTIDYEGSLETYDPYEGEEVSFDFGIQALSVSFVAPTPADAATVTEGNVDVNVSITDGASLLDLTYNWNGTNTSVYNDSLVFFGEFGSNSTTTDASSYAASGTNTGAAHTSSGKYGYAYDFDGSDYITYTDNARYTYGTSFTITAWIDNHARGDYNVIAGTYNGNGFMLANHFSNNRLLVHDGGWNDNSCSAIADNTGWKHVALVRSGTSLTYYVDGEVDCTDTGTSSSRDGGDLAIGADAGYEFDGLIDQVRIYNATLSHDEINQLYLTGLEKTGASTWVLSVNQTKNATDNLSYGDYTYQVFADSDDTGERTIKIREFLTEPNLTKFDGSSGYTGDVGFADITLENKSSGIVSWEGVNVTLLNFNAYVTIRDNFIDVDVANLHSSLNMTADLGLNISVIDPVIYRDDVVCNDCDVLNYSGGRLYFNTSHFSNFTIGENASLTIWDDTNDAEGENTEHALGDQVGFYANFTNSSLLPINGVNDYCEYSHNDTGSFSAPVNMTYNSTSTLYEYNTSFANGGEFTFNVTCVGDEVGIGSLSTTDSFVIQSIIAPSFVAPTPADASTVDAASFYVNTTISDDNLTTVIYELNDVNLTIFNDSLLSFINFDNVSSLGDSSSVVTDHSNDGNQALTLVNGPTYVDTPWGKGLDLDGVDDYFEHTAGAVYQNLGEMTISAWVKKEGEFSGTAQTGLFGNYRRSTGAAAYGFAYTDLTDTLTFNWRAPTVESIDLDETWTTSDGWTHLLATYDGSIVKVYRNGVVDPTTASDTGDMYYYTSQRYAGGNTGGVFANMIIDEMYHWDRALTEAEIELLYGASLRKLNSSEWILSINQSDPSGVLPYDTYEFQVFIENNGPNEAQTEKRTITAGIPDLAPLISFVSPTPANATVSSNSSFEVNVSIQDTSLVNVSYEWNGTTVQFFNDSVLAWHNFDNNADVGDSSTLANDVGPGDEQDFNLSGSPVFVSTPWGKGLKLDGVNDYFRHDTQDVYQDLDTMTISAWVKKEGEFSSGAETVLFGNSKISNGVKEYGFTFTDTSDLLKFSGNGQSSFEVTLDDEWNTSNGWTHLLGMHNGTHVKVFRDGVLQSTTYADSGPITGTVSTDSRYGGGFTASTYGNYIIDELYHWNTSFTDQEVNAMYALALRKINSTQWQLNVIHNETGNRPLPFDTYTYQLTASDILGQTNSTEQRFYTYTLISNEPIFSKFDGSTGYDGSAADANITLENTTAGSLMWRGVDISALDFNSYVTIRDNFIDVDVANLHSSLNMTADLGLNISVIDPVIYRDDVVCNDCDVLNYSGGRLYFNTSHFSNFTIGENASLTIWDDTNDAEGENVDHQINQLVGFYSNFTNSSASPINDSNDYCEFSHNNTGSFSSPVNMSYNATSELYEHNTTFANAGTFTFSITCHGDEVGIGDITLTDTYVLVSNLPPAVDSVILNATDHPSNTTSANLTGYVTASDESDNVSLVYNWYLDGSLNATNVLINDSSLVAYYSFDNDLKDYAGDYDAFNNGSTSNSSGITGGSRSFNGVDQYVRLPGNATGNMIEGASSSTISTWVYYNALESGQYDNVVYSGSIVFNSNLWLNVRGDGVNSGKVLFGGRSQSSDIFQEDSTSANLSSGEWNHIVGVLDYQNDEISIAINGLFEASESVTFESSTYVHSSTDNEDRIGTSVNTPTVSTEFFDGLIDEIQIYNRTLSDLEVAQLYYGRDHMHSDNTVKGDAWTLGVVGCDSTECGDETNSSSLVIENSLPVASGLVLNATDHPSNLTSANLTLYIGSSTDDDGDSVKNITDWQLFNGTDWNSIAVLNMPMENTTSAPSTIRDYSTYSNNGTNNGAIFNATGGYDGRGAYEFNGAGDYINVTNSSEYQLTTSLTVSSWVKFNETSTSKAIVSKSDFDELKSGYVLFHHSDDRFRFDGGDGTTWTSLSLISSGTYSTTDSWYHVVATYEEPNGYLYVNGVQVATDTSAALATDEKELWIGDDIDAPGVSTWSGTIDEVQIYNRLLSAEQVVALYNNQSNLIVSDETLVDNVWRASVTPNAAGQDGTLVYSNNITIEDSPNNPPVVNDANLTATDDPLNTTNANLTTSISSSDFKGSNISLVYNWYENGSLNATNVLINDSSLVAYYPLNNDTLDYAGDYDAFNNGSTSNSSGITGGSRSFNGVDQYVRLPGNATGNMIEGASSSTISTWVYYNALESGQYDNVVYSGSIVFDSNLWLNVRGDGVNSGKVLFGGRSQSSDNFQEDSTSANLSSGEWNHIVGVLDYQNDEISIAINGLFEASESVTFGSSTYVHTSTDNEDRIGTSVNTPTVSTHFFDGLIDEIQIYNRTLSDLEVAQLYYGRDYMHSDNTVKGDVWTLGVLGCDSSDCGNETISNNVTILNSLPVVTSVILNSTNVATNGTSENLTGFPTSSDGDGENVTHVYNWYKNGILNATTLFEEDASLIAYYPLDNDVNDYSGNQLAGTNNGATLNTTGGQVEGAYEFDGVGDYINLGSSSEIDGVFDGTQNFTIVAWYDLSALGAYRTLFTKGGVGGGKDYGGTMSFVYDTFIADNGGAGGYAFTIYDGSEADDYIMSFPDAQFPLDEWAQIAIRYDSDSINADVYINGQNVTGKSLYQGPAGYDGSEITAALGDDLLFGAEFLASSSYWTGAMDEIQVYGRLLGGSEISKLYYGSVNGGSSLNSSQTIKGDVWTLGVVGCDPDPCGDELNSTPITILNSLPVVSGVVLNSTDVSLNDTNQNLAGYTTSADGDGENITHVYNWYRNGTLNATTVFEGDANLVAYYPLDNDVNDYSENELHGTNNGATLNATGGQVAGAYGFDGVDNEITFNQQLVPLGAKTITAWYNTEDSNFNQIYSNEGGASANYGSRLAVSSSGITFTVRKGTPGSDNLEVTSSDANNDGKWHHIVATWDGSTSAGAAKLFVDGVFSSSDTAAEAETIVASKNMSIGSYGTGGFWDGSLDEIQIYNRSLNSSEVSQLYYGSAYGGSVMNASQTTVGDVWTLGVVGCDPDPCGEEVNSSSITILETPNSAPVVNEVNLTATDDPNNLTEANLTLSIDSSDFDSDNVSLVYNWYKDDVFNATNVFINDSSLVAYYPLDNDVLDYSSNNLHGTNFGAIRDASEYRVGASYDFDTSTYFSVPSAGEFNLTNNLTISSWVKFNTTSDQKVIVARSDPDTAKAGYVLFHGSDDKFYFSGGDGINWITLFMPSAGTYTDTDRWYHVVGTFEGTQGYLYVNNVEVASDTSAALAPIDDSLFIGKNSLDSASNWHGQLDEIQIYNKSLSASEISQLYFGSAFGGDVMNSSQTTVDDVWKVGIIGCDDENCSSEGYSNNITILADPNTAPNVTSIIPVNGSIKSAFENITISANVVDDGVVDTVLANISLSNGTIIQIELNDQGSNNYSNAYVLPSSGFVNITVIANDTLGLVNDSESVTIEVLDTLIVNLFDTNIDLGQLDLGQTRSSEDAADFISIRNDGSLDVDVYVYGFNSPFTSTTGAANVLPTSSFQVHMNSSESGSTNITYVDMPANFSTKHLLVESLQADDSFDEAELGVQLNVPTDEISGGKNAIFTVYVEAD